MFKNELLLNSSGERKRMYDCKNNFKIDMKFVSVQFKITYKKEIDKGIIEIALT